MGERVDDRRRKVTIRAGMISEHSITEISEAAGVSSRQVSKMRAAKHKLEHRAHGYGSWREADRAARGLGSRRIDGEQLQEEAHAASGGPREAPLKGVRWNPRSEDPEVAAWALAIHFDRRFDELLWVSFGNWPPKTKQKTMKGNSPSAFPNTER